MSRYQSSIWFWEELPGMVVEEMADSLPPFRKEKMLSYVFDRDRILCAKAYKMLESMLHDNYGLSQIPDFRFGPDGKPFLNDSDIFFNLSHCPKAVLCVTSTEEVGCDIEEIYPSLDIDLCKACFNDREMNSILSADDPNIEFAKLWTAKEAYLKLTGEGLTDRIRDILSESVRSRVSFDTRIFKEQGCVSTIAMYFD